jgi:hypothetical protein
LNELEKLSRRTLTSKTNALGHQQPWRALFCNISQFTKIMAESSKRILIAMKDKTVLNEHKRRDGTPRGGRKVRST